MTDTGTDRLARARRVVEAALGKKALNVLALDVRELVSFADTFVLATGTSDRHLRSIVDGILEAFAAEGEKPLGIEGYEEGRWVLVDLGDLVVHVFLADVREYYDLERLWADAPVLDLGGDLRSAS